MTITFDYLEDLVLRARVHTLQHEDLYFKRLLPSIDASYANSDIYTKDVIACELLEIQRDWERSEITTLGFVSAYHLWEKQIREIVRYQFKRYKRTARPNNRESFPDYARRILENELELVHPKPQLWVKFREACMVVNAFKHGLGPSFTSVQMSHPEYVVPPATRSLDPVISVPEEKLRQYIDTANEYWAGFPYKLDYRRSHAKQSVEPVA